MFNFLHNFTPQPVFFEIGFFSVRYYGLFILLSLIVSILLSLKLAKKNNFTSDEVFDLAFWAILSGIIGARLYFVFILEFFHFLSNPIDIIKIWQGGLAIHGAIIGGVLGLYFWSKKNKKNFWQLTDIVSIILPLAQAIGRFGNYFNQELFGKPTDLPWGIAIEVVNRPFDFLDKTHFHPTFLYESILNLFLFCLLFLLYQKNKLKGGQYIGVYLIGYGVIRFLMEIIRVDQTILIFNFKLPQIISLILIAIGLMVIYKKNKKAV